VTSALGLVVKISLVGSVVEPEPAPPVFLPEPEPEKRPAPAPAQAKVRRLNYNPIFEQIKISQGR